VKVALKTITFSLVGLLFLLPGVTSATQGACSYHQGVNCAAGPTYSGNVMCNDGWINSSVRFADAEECKVVSQCSYPVQPFCNLSEIDTQKQSALGSQGARDGRSGQLGSDMASSRNASIENEYQTKYSTCESIWAAYESQKNRYNSCINQQEEAASSLHKQNLDATCREMIGAGSTFDSKKRECTPIIDAQFDSHLDKLIANAKFHKQKCETQNGEGSKWSWDTNTCSKSSTQNCRDMFGPNSYSSPGSTDCIACKDGYIQQSDGSCSLKKQGFLSSFKAASVQPTVRASPEATQEKVSVSQTPALEEEPIVSPAKPQTFWGKTVSFIEGATAQTKQFWDSLFKSRAQ